MRSAKIRGNDFEWPAQHHVAHQVFDGKHREAVPVSSKSQAQSQSRSANDEALVWPTVGEIEDEVKWPAASLSADDSTVIEKEV